MGRELRLRLVVVALTASLVDAAPADARKFQMSGTWLMRRGSGFLPLQFGGSAGGTQRTHASMGSWTEAPFYPPGQVVSNVAGASATGSGPATLKLPRHRWKQEQDVLVPLSGIVLVQITTMLQIDAPYATATLRAGDGPGSFTWCPSNPACTAGGPVPGAGTMDGRVVYVAGPNQFGGTMQMGLRGGGVGPRPVGGMPFRVVHLHFWGSGSTLRRRAVGGGANDAPSIVMQSLGPAYVTAPTVAPPMGSPILHPGPFVTTMLGNTLTMPTGMKWKFPATGPSKVSTSRGFPHTTGTILVQQTFGSDGDDLFTVMGSDARTPLGAGNLNTVAGGLVRVTPFCCGVEIAAQFDKVFLELAPPVPSISPAGAAAAGLLILLAVGYALRRRPERSSG